MGNAGFISSTVVEAQELETQRPHYLMHKESQQCLTVVQGLGFRVLNLDPMSNLLGFTLNAQAKHPNPQAQCPMCVVEFVSQYLHNELQAYKHQTLEKP